MISLDRMRAARLVEAAAARVVEHQDELSRLDAIAGDGDHGINMARALTEARRRLEERPPETAGAVFGAVGSAFVEAVGGAAGALMGAFFGGVGASLESSSASGAAELAAALRQGLDRLQRVGGTGRGEKTMVDALEPAVEAAEASAVAGASLDETMAAAAAAAAAGAASTADMRPTAGRARYAADESLGSPDPGATTISLLFGAWADALTQEVSA